MIFFIQKCSLNISKKQPIIKLENQMLIMMIALFLIYNNRIVFFLNGLAIENDKNILVSDFEETKNGVKTRLNVNLSNTSLLEHRHDHFSAVVLIDAVIQSSICYLSKNYHGSRWRLKSLKSKYNRFIEIVGFTSIDISKYRGVNFSDEIRIEAKIIQFGEISSEFSVIFKSDNY
ncbi:hypothetical protein [Dickeya ananatis]